MQMFLREHPTARIVSRLLVSRQLVLLFRPGERRPPRRDGEAPHRRRRGRREAGGRPPRGPSREGHDRKFRQSIFFLIVIFTLLFPVQCTILVSNLLAKKAMYH